MRTPKTRAVALVAAACLSAGGAAVPAAHAASATKAADTAAAAGWGQAIPITGTGKGAKAFTGTFTIKRFVQTADGVEAVGTLAGKLKNRPVVRRGVHVPATIADGAPTARAAQTTNPIPPTPNACQVLSLVLGPLDLNLLGLRVRLNQVRLLIEAVPSAGNTGGQAGGLLGDLLCGITNLLAPSANSPLDAVTRLLNALLALAGPAPVGTR